MTLFHQTTAYAAFQITEKKGSLRNQKVHSRLLFLLLLLLLCRHRERKREEKHDLGTSSYSSSPSSLDPITMRANIKSHFAGERTTLACHVTCNARPEIMAFFWVKPLATFNTGLLWTDWVIPKRPLIIMLNDSNLNALLYSTFYWF